MMTMIANARILHLSSRLLVIHTVSFFISSRGKNHLLFWVNSLNFNLVSTRIWERIKSSYILPHFFFQIAKCSSISFRRWENPVYWIVIRYIVIKSIIKTLNRLETWFRNLVTYFLLVIIYTSIQLLSVQYNYDFFFNLFLFTLLFIVLYIVVCVSTERGDKILLSPLNPQLCSKY